LETQRLPWALRAKDRVDQGEKLSDVDILFLEEVLTDANQVRSIVDRHPEYQDLVIKVLSLYKHITEKGLQNEQGGSEA